MRHTREMISVVSKFIKAQPSEEKTFPITPGASMARWSYANEEVTCKKLEVLATFLLDVTLLRIEREADVATAFMLSRPHPHRGIPPSPRLWNLSVARTHSPT